MRSSAGSTGRVFDWDSSRYIHAIAVEAVFAGDGLPAVEVSDGGHEG